MGDGLDTTSTEIVKLGVATAELVVLKIFSEVEPVSMRRLRLCGAVTVGSLRY